MVVSGITEKTKGGKRLWECVCDCGNIHYATKSNLNHGKTLSCGCLHKEVSVTNGHNNKKYNKYNIDGEYGKGYTSSGYEFYFDLCDYDLIRKYCWHKHQDGYLRTCNEIYPDGRHHYIMMHQLLMGRNGADHINGKTFDNRRENLRVIPQIDNSKNLKIRSDNKTGCAGTFYSERENKYKAYITYDKNRLHIGTFGTLEDAIKARKNAEEKYFGEFARKGI